MARSLTLWTSVAYPAPLMDLLREGTDGHRLLQAQTTSYSALAAPTDDPGLAEADVAFGQPSPEAVLKHANLRWVQITSAGYTPFDRPDLRAAFRARDARFTNSSSVYAEPCAQHAVAMILSQARQLPASYGNQFSAHGWPYKEIRAHSTLVNGQTILLVGFGAIAQRLAELLAPLQMNITAIRRTPTGREPVPTLPTAQLDALLPSADHVVNLLPLSPETKHFFDARRFAQMKPGAVYYSIGRGDTTEQAALRAALLAGTLAAAHLDVTTPEPLPPTDPLWTTPHCHITPHTAGGHTTEFTRIIQHFLQNLRRYEHGEALVDRVF